VLSLLCLQVGEGNKQGELAVASYFGSRAHCNAEVTFGPDVR